MRLPAAVTIVLSLLFPAAADARCRTHINTAWLGTPVVHKRLFATTLSTAWCFNGRRVTRVRRVRVYPSLTRLGTIASWEYRGVSARDGRLVAVRGTARRAYRLRRVVHWRRCAARCFYLYLEMNSLLYWDGRAGQANRLRRG